MTKLRERVNEAYRSIGETDRKMEGCKRYLDLVDLVDAEVNELPKVLEVVGTDEFIGKAVQRARVVLVESIDVKGLMLRHNGLTVVGDGSRLLHAEHFGTKHTDDPVREVHGDYYGAAIKKAARAQLMGGDGDTVVQRLDGLSSLMIGHEVRGVRDVPLTLGHAATRSIGEPKTPEDSMARHWDIGVTGMQAEDGVHEWMTRVLDRSIDEDRQLCYFEDDVDVLAGFYDQVVADRTVDELQKLYGIEVPARSTFIGSHSLEACDLRLRGANLH